MAETNFTSKQVASGSLWTLISFGLTSGVRLASSLVLTRILPDASSIYGVMALVLGFYSGILLFTDIGIGMLLTQNPRGMEPAFRQTAFTAQIVRGVVIWLAAIALAPFFASAYPEFDGLQELLSVIALSAFIGGFSSTSLSAFLRRMQVRKLAKIELTSQVFGTAVTIIHALLLPSAWSMVSGSLAAVSLKVILSHWLSDAPDRLGWNRDAASQIKTVGRWIFVSTALTFCVDFADRLMFGQLVSTELLGVYSVAIVFSQTLRQLLQQLSRNVLYPMLCEAERANGSTEEVFRIFRLPIVAGGGFAYTCLCGGGGALMQLLYEGDFALGGWMLQVTACGAWFNTALGAPRTQVALSKAKPKHTATANFGMILAMVVLIPFGHAAFGFPGAVTGFATANIARYAVTLGLNRKLGVGALGQDLALSLRFIAASAAILWVDEVLQQAGTSALVRCLCAGAIAGIVWLKLAWTSFRNFQQAQRALA